MRDVQYLLDTDICIQMIRRRPAVLLRRVRDAQPGSLALSIITVAELWYGAQKSSQPDQNRSALKMFLRPFSILPFGEEAAQYYGRVRADLEAGGIPIGPLDTLIASQALQQRATLITHNTREFSRVEGLLVEDWLAAPS